MRFTLNMTNEPILENFDYCATPEAVALIREELRGARLSHGTLSVRGAEGDNEMSLCWKAPNRDPIAVNVPRDSFAEAANAHMAVQRLLMAVSLRDRVDRGA